MTALELPGVLTRAQVRRTAEHIAGLQQPDGLIPWFEGHYGDAWNHVEAAMAMHVAGLRREARRAFHWLAEHQAADGSWPMETVGTDVREASVDTNQVAYVAVGVLHDWLLTGDRRFVADMWPVVRSAVELVVSLQQPGGAVCWSRDAAGVVNPDALLTGSACIVLSLRAALALADLVGDPQPDWELSVERLAHAVAAHPGDFADKSNFSMDWYYPVLGGAVRGGAGHEHLQARWEEFVRPGRGCRCVSDRPWVTAAETAELALTLDALGDRGRALRLMADVQFLRTDGGGYWTGWVWDNDTVWPREQSCWTSGAMVLAVDALSRHSSANGIFRGDGMPQVLLPDECDHCMVRAGGR